MLKSEIAGLSNILPKIFGYYIAQIGGPTGDNGILSTSKIHNHIIINPSTVLSHGLLAVQCNLDELPFLPESIDAIVLFHALEISKNPKAVLKEAYNSLINGGYLIILGFNPRSLWGINKFLQHAKGEIWSGDWIPTNKLRHWLVQLGFCVGDYQTFYFRPPHKNPEKMLFLEGIGQIFWPYSGASYMFVAHKTSTIVTPINAHKSRISHQELAKALPKPTSRVIQ